MGVQLKLVFFVLVSVAIAFASAVFLLSQGLSPLIIIAYNLFIVYLFFGFFLFLNHFCSVSLKKLAQDIEKMSREDSSPKQIDSQLLSRKDELGQLARSLSKLTDQFASKIGDLCRQVEQRTIEVQSTNQELEGVKETMRGVLHNLKIQEQNLERDKARDEALLESIGDGLVATDKNGTVLVINKATEDLFGFTHSEIVGKKFYEIIPMTDSKGALVPADKGPMKLALELNERLHTEDYSLLAKGTNKFPAAITVAPIHLNGEIIGSIALYRNITHEKDVDRMKTEFISLASHQLRTPLSAIKWFAELLTDSGHNLTSEQADFLKNISLSTERMIELVNALLNVSRIESGRIIIDPKPTNLVELVNGVITELQEKINAKHHHVIVSAHQSLPIINIDPRLIRQVYLNLLSNAVKYTPDGGEIEIFISKSEYEIISQVSDNGYGIPLKDQSKLFQKFFRAENIVKVEADGNGLGMYLVKAVIESSGGRIWFESLTPGEAKAPNKHGTTFWFSLPLSGTPPKAGEVTINS